MRRLNLEIIKYTKADYKVLLEWFAQWEWTPCDADCIPTNSYFIVRDGKKVAFSCFLATDCSVAIMGMTLCDKEARGRGEAVDALIKHMIASAKSQGYKYLHYYTDSEVMVDRMERQGLKVTDRGTAYILIGDLGGGRTEFFEE